MSTVKYRIYRLSARAIIGHGKERADGYYQFELNRRETSKCILSGMQEQDDNALFYQIMDELQAGVTPSAENSIIEALSDIIVYVDFSGIFDRSAEQKRYADRQQKAKSMFRPEGITLDLGNGAQRYVAFERSASMSRRAMLSFIRADLYEPIRKRIMLDLQVGMCQLVIHHCRREAGPVFTHCPKQDAVLVCTHTTQLNHKLIGFCLIKLR